MMLAVVATPYHVVEPPGTQCAVRCGRGEWQIKVCDGFRSTLEVDPEPRDSTMDFAWFRISRRSNPLSAPPSRPRALQVRGQKPHGQQFKLVGNIDRES
jgi:hypothetical protein